MKANVETYRTRGSGVGSGRAGCPFKSGEETFYCHLFSAPFPLPARLGAETAGRMPRITMQRNTKSTTARPWLLVHCESTEAGRHHFIWCILSLSSLLSAALSTPCLSLPLSSSSSFASSVAHRSYPIEARQHCDRIEHSADENSDVGVVVHYA